MIDCPLIECRPDDFPPYPFLPTPSLVDRITGALLDLPASLFAVAIELATLAALALAIGALWTIAQAIR